MQEETAEFLGLASSCGARLTIASFAPMASLQAETQLHLYTNLNEAAFRTGCWIRNPNARFYFMTLAASLSKL